MPTGIIRTVIGVALGALLGLAYHTFIGCRTGSCPLTSNPFITMAYGAIMGLILTYR